MIGLRDLAFISGNSIDKVVKSGSGSFNIPGGGAGSATIAHGLPSRPFMTVQWSLDNVNWFPSNHLDNQTNGPLAATQVWGYVGNTNLVIYGNSNGGGARTCYYRYELFLMEL